MNNPDQRISLLVVAIDDHEHADVLAALESDDHGVFEYECARTVETAEACLRKNDYDAVLISAERGPGPERIRQLCRSRDTPPIIAICRNADGPSSERAYAEGADGLLVKEEFGAHGLRSAYRSAVMLWQARQEAAAADERWRRLAENLPAGLFELDGRGRLVGANAWLLNLLGDRDRRRLEERIRAGALFARGHDRYAWLRAIVRGEAVTGAELELRHVNGSVIHAVAACAPVRDSRGILKAFEGLITDVTGMRTLERQFLLAQKMEAVGQMTSGIAHDFSNLLTIILGNLYLIEQTIGADHRMATTVSATRQAARQGKELTGRLLAFAKQEIREPEILDLNDCIIRLQPLLERTLGDRATLAIIGADGPARVRADAVQLENALLNLAINARDAMAGGGTLNIAVRTVDSAPALCEISVSDTGSGIAPEVKERLFEPFVTTKTEGSGLGLSMVQAFVKTAGGSISVDSEPGEGTRFRLLLPAVTG